jgi:hypothetical protein
MKCPKCRHENPADSTFCGKCATKLGDEAQPSFTKTIETSHEELTPGSSLAGRYRIIDELGRGGMGTVYRAEDTSLSRHVAIKVLPDEFANDPERLARFEREAKLLAALNHPNIAAIHGIEAFEGKRFLVLELAEGETLRDRLERGPLADEDALETCKQLAEGLEAAHEKGIIHRDLKPGNIMITPEGKVKILDFGLAKAYPTETTNIDIEKSPTITAQMTAPGVIMGTAAYMSPEQARGRPVDKRADIWAFGCVLYECLTGSRAFYGETVSDTLAHILKGEPDWNKLPAKTPRLIDVLLRRCLARNPKNRLHDIADARIVIDESGFRSAEGGEAIKRSPLGWIFAVGAILFIAGFLIRPLIWETNEAMPSSESIASVIKVQPGYALDGDRDNLEFGWPTLTAMVISGDGRFIVYCAGDDAAADAKPSLFMRRIDELEAGPIPGTEGGIAPFLSADDRWVGFWADGKLKKVPVEGGIAQDLCKAGMYGACWGVNDRIVFSDDVNQGLSSIAASGGDPEVITVPDIAQDEGYHRLPSYLPNDRGILFTVIRSGMGLVKDLNPRVALFDSRTGERKFLIDDASDAQYILTGHIVFLRRGELWAVPFSLQELETTGPSMPIRSDIVQALIPTGRNTTAGQYSISESGRLIFAPGGVPPPWVNSLAWVDSQGKDEPACSQLDQHYIPRLSPDGKKIAYQTLFLSEHILIWDIQREMSYPLVSEGACGYPVWTPDGKKIIYRKILPDRQSGIFSISADGIGSTEELIISAPPGRIYIPTSVSPDGKRLALISYETDQASDIYLYDFISQSCAPFRVTPYDECGPSFSPDGLWIIYSSDQEGRYDVYVSPADGSGGSIMVSMDGGMEPVWARNGRRFFYRSYRTSLSALFSQVWAVDVRSGTEFSAGKPRLLFESQKFGVSLTVPCWDISLDDKLFLMVRREDRPPKPITEFVLIQNWFEEFKRLVPAGKK